MAKFNLGEIVAKFNLDVGDIKKKANDAKSQMATFARGVTRSLLAAGAAAVPVTDSIKTILEAEQKSHRARLKIMAQARMKKREEAKAYAESAAKIKAAIKSVVGSSETGRGKSGRFAMMSEKAFSILQKTIKGHQELINKLGIIERIRKRLALAKQLRIIPPSKRTRGGSGGFLPGEKTLGQDPIVDPIGAARSTLSKAREAALKRLHDLQARIVKISNRRKHAQEQLAGTHRKTLAEITSAVVQLNTKTGGNFDALRRRLKHLITQYNEATNKVSIFGRAAKAASEKAVIKAVQKKVRESAASVEAARTRVQEAGGKKQTRRAQKALDKEIQAHEILKGKLEDLITQYKKVTDKAGSFGRAARDAALKAVVGQLDPRHQRRGGIGVATGRVTAANRVQAALATSLSATRAAVSRLATSIGSRLLSAVQGLIVHIRALSTEMRANLRSSIIAMILLTRILARTLMEQIVLAAKATLLEFRAMARVMLDVVVPAFKGLLLNLRVMASVMKDIAVAAASAFLLKIRALASVLRDRFVLAAKAVVNVLRGPLGAAFRIANRSAIIFGKGIAKLGLGVFKTTAFLSRMSLGLVKLSARLSLMAAKSLPKVYRGITKIALGIRKLSTTLFSLRTIATAAATILGAFGLSQVAANVSNMTVAFGSLARALGSDPVIGLQKLRKALKNTVDDLEIARSTSRAVIFNIADSIDDLAAFFNVARRLGRATGRSTSQAIEDITLGIGRQSRLILDNIGLIVRVRIANENYAAVLRKSSEDLTDLEKREAFRRAALEAAAIAVARLGRDTTTFADIFFQAQTSVKQFVNTLAATLTPAMRSLTETFRDFLGVEVSDKGLVKSIAAPIAVMLFGAQKFIEERGDDFRNVMSDVSQFAVTGITIASLTFRSVFARINRILRDETATEMARWVGDIVNFAAKLITTVFKIIVNELVTTINDVVITFFSVFNDKKMAAQRESGTANLWNQLIGEAKKPTTKFLLTFAKEVIAVGVSVIETLMVTLAHAIRNINLPGFGKIFEGLEKEFLLSFHGLKGDLGLDQLSGIKNIDQMNMLMEGLAERAERVAATITPLDKEIKRLYKTYVALTRLPGQLPAADALEELYESVRARDFGRELSGQPSWVDALKDFTQEDRDLINEALDDYRSIVPEAIKDVSPLALVPIPIALAGKISIEGANAVVGWIKDLTSLVDGDQLKEMEKAVVALIKKREAQLEKAIQAEPRARERRKGYELLKEDLDMRLSIIQEGVKDVETAWIRLMDIPPGEVRKAVKQGLADSKLIVESFASGLRQGATVDFLNIDPAAFKGIDDELIEINKLINKNREATEEFVKAQSPPDKAGTGIFSNKQQSSIFDWEELIRTDLEKELATLNKRTEGIIIPLKVDPEYATAFRVIINDTQGVATTTLNMLRPLATVAELIEQGATGVTRWTDDIQRFRSSLSLKIEDDIFSEMVEKGKDVSARFTTNTLSAREFNEIINDPKLLVSMVSMDRVTASLGKDFLALAENKNILDDIFGKDPEKKFIGVAKAQAEFTKRISDSEAEIKAFIDAGTGEESILRSIIIAIQNLIRARSQLEVIDQNDKKLRVERVAALASMTNKYRDAIRATLAMAKATQAFTEARDRGESLASDTALGRLASARAAAEATFEQSGLPSILKGLFVFTLVNLERLKIAYKELIDVTKLTDEAEASFIASLAGISQVKLGLTRDEISLSNQLLANQQKLEKTTGKKKGDSGFDLAALALLDKATRAAHALKLVTAAAALTKTQTNALEVANLKLKDSFRSLTEDAQARALSLLDIEHKFRDMIRTAESALASAVDQEVIEEITALIKELNDLKAKEIQLVDKAKLTKDLEEFKAIFTNVFESIGNAAITAARSGSNRLRDVLLAAAQSLTSLMQPAMERMAATATMGVRKTIEAVFKKLGIEANALYNDIIGVIIGLIAASFVKDNVDISEIEEAGIDASSQAVRGVIAGPQSIAIAEIGSSIAEANSGVESLLSDILNVLEEIEGNNLTSGGVGAAGTI